MTQSMEYSKENQYTEFKIYNWKETITKFNSWIAVKENLIILTNGPLKM